MSKCYWNRPLLNPISYQILTHKWHPLLVNLIFFILLKMMTELNYERYQKGFSPALAKTFSTENSNTQSKTFVSPHIADEVY